jgi:hypothetical protein
VLAAGTLSYEHYYQLQVHEFVIPDNREGWVESLRLLLLSYFDQNQAAYVQAPIALSLTIHADSCRRPADQGLRWRSCWAGAVARNAQPHSSHSQIAVSEPRTDVDGYRRHHESDR